MKLIPRQHNNVLWNPFREVERIQEDLGHLFNFSLGKWIDTEPGTSGQTWIPAIDVVDTKNNLRIKAEIPGLDKNDIHVSIDGNTLTIKGEKKQEETKEEEGYLRTERVYGSFFRSVTLPQAFNPDQVHANYKNGVLELTLAKKEEAKPKQIEVKVE